MGYEIHITRADDWTESESHPITLDSWKAYIASDSEMRLDGYAEAATPSGDTIRVESEGLAVWVAYSGDNKDGNHAWMDWRRGRISVKNPDKEILGKILQIAFALEAKVQGDGGELYECIEHYDNPIHDDHFEPEKEAASVANKVPWWKRLFGK